MLAEFLQRKRPHLVGDVKSRLEKGSKEYSLISDGTASRTTRILGYSTKNGLW